MIGTWLEQEIVVTPTTFATPTALESPSGGYRSVYALEAARKYTEKARSIIDQAAGQGISQHRLVAVNWCNGFEPLSCEQ